MLKKISQIFIAAVFLFSLAGCTGTVTKSSNTFQKLDENGEPAAVTNANLTAANYNVQLGVGYLQEGDVQRAKRKLLLALDQAPNWPPALDAMAFFLESTGDLDKANSYYLQAINAAPNQGSSLNNYGTFLCRTKHFKEADQYFLRAIQDTNYVNTAEAYENAGICAMQVPDANKAMAYFQRAVQQDPKRQNSYLEMSQLIYNQGNYVLAQKYFDNYAALAPNLSADGLWLGIRLARQLEDSKTAARYALLLQNNYPHSPEYQQLRGSTQPIAGNNVQLKL